MTNDPFDGFPPAEWDTELGMFKFACRELIDAVLSLVPDYARDSIRDYERDRGETTADERRDARRELIGTAKNPSDAEVIKAGLNAVTYATWAMKRAAEEDDVPFFYSCNLYAEASRLLGGIQGHLGAIPDPEETMQQSRAALGRSGGNARAAGYELKKERAKALYAQWQSGALKIPDVRPGRRMEDFDDYAAKQVGASERSIRDWRANW